MKRLIMGLMVISVTGCAWTSNFEAKTLQGAQCKQDCARDGTFCNASSYSCDKARSYCYSSCREIDELAFKAK